MTGVLKDWSATAANNTTAATGIAVSQGTLFGSDHGAARAIMAAVKALANQLTGAKTTGGSSNAYTFTSDTAGTISTAYAAGMAFTFRADRTNTGPATLNVDGVGAKSIKRIGGGELKAGDLVAGGLYPAAYQATLDAFLLLDGAAGVAPGLLFGLTLSNNGSDATNDIDVAAGECADSTGAVRMALASAITKRLDASWAVGTNQGGLDAGTIANTTYHVWLIMRSDTGVVDVLFSTSASSPTMPTNYDYKRRIGSVIRSGGTILAFTQIGDLFRLATPVTDVSSTNPGTSAVSRTLTVPSGVAVLAKMIVRLATSSTGDDVYISELFATDNAATTPSVTLSTSTNPLSVGGELERYTNTSAQIRTRQVVGDASQTLVIRTTGWADSRGRLA